MTERVEPSDVVSVSSDGIGAGQGEDGPVAVGGTVRARFDAYVIPLAFFLVAANVYALINNGRPAQLDYFVPLADSFVHWQLGLLDGPSWLNELVPGSNGLFYVVYPPAPALILVPFVAIFGAGFSQASASIVLGGLNVAIASTVIAGMGASRYFRIAMSLVFGFGTIVWFSAQAGSAWHFAQVVATLFMLLAIRACQRDAPTALIGLLFAGAVLSRLPLLLAMPFFLAYLADRTIRGRSAGAQRSFGTVDDPPGRAWERRPDAARFIRLAIPMAVGLGLPLFGYLLYDRARFGSFFETGYALIPGLFLEGQYRYGIFSTVNIPRNLYALLLNTPVQVPDFPWVQSRLLGGLSILLTSPIFLWSIRARRPDWFGLGAWASVALILVPILLHADPGGAQFGFRYAQDVYPFLLVLTVRGLGGRFSFESGIAVAVGLLVNVWGMASAYFDWWA